MGCSLKNIAIEEGMGRLWVIGIALPKYLTSQVQFSKIIEIDVGKQQVYQIPMNYSSQFNLCDFG
jgi:hypothetical protein